MFVCLLCKTPLSDSNRTVEHIIPASLGGSLTSDVVICRDCNSRMGDSLDSTLSKHLQVLVFGFDVVNAREPGKGVSPLRWEAADGTPIMVRHGSGYATTQRMDFTREQGEDTLHISFTVPLGENYERLVARKLEELKRHYGQENIIRTEVVNEVHEAPPISFAVETMLMEPEFLRAVARLTWSFACHSLRTAGLPELDYTGIRGFVREGKACRGNIITGFQTGSSDLCDDDACPKHFLACAVFNRSLWGCAVLFGCLPFVVCVADVPSGFAEFQAACVLDPEAGIHRADDLFCERFTSFLKRFGSSLADQNEMVIGIMRAAAALQQRGKEAALPDNLMRVILQQAIAEGILPAQMLEGLGTELGDRAM